MPKRKDPPDTMPAGSPEQHIHQTMFTEYDAVIGGSGGLANKMRHKSLYQQLIQEHCCRYYNLKKGSKRDYARHNIIQPILQQGGRFWAVDSTGHLTELTDEVMIEAKVMNALRDRALTIERTTSSEAPQREISPVENTFVNHLSDADRQLMEHTMKQIPGLEQFDTNVLFHKGEGKVRTKDAKINYRIFRAAQEILTRIVFRRNEGFYRRQQDLPTIVIQIFAERRIATEKDDDDEQHTMVEHVRRSQERFVINSQWEASPVCWLTDRSSYAYSVSRNDIHTPITEDEVVSFLKAYRQNAYNRLMVYQLYVSGGLADVVEREGGSSSGVSECDIDECRQQWKRPQLSPSAAAAAAGMAPSDRSGTGGGAASTRSGR